MPENPLDKALREARERRGIANVGQMPNLPRDQHSTKAEDDDEITCPNCGAKFSADDDSDDEDSDDDDDDENGYRTDDAATKTGGDDDANRRLVDNPNSKLTPMQQIMLDRGYSRKQIGLD